ncbi:ADP-ribosylglycohydrolase family protein [Thiohalocapsa marina]|uniref:ADP-ribosylglycohydrolase family protein n=1 Tax=Thiohalocapsa marina TaxID=424902 RepID=UPI0014785668|nr:ADP-ribosylglycohydrolase family protein [Thiohalocapsa marina]
MAIFLARSGVPALAITETIVSRFGYDFGRTVDDIRANNPHSDACQETVPEAMTCALTADSFEDAMRNAVSIGGDSDTIAAIAGSLAEPLFGLLDEIKNESVARLPEDIVRIIQQYYADSRVLGSY